MIASDVRYFRQIADLLPADPPPRLISEYVQGRRIMPSGTPFPGPWDNARTPYWVEIMDSMSPFSHIRHGVLMKPRKMGATALAECIAAYWVDANPTALEYTTATDELAQDWSTKRWEHVVDSLGFRHKLVAQTIAKSRRTGDTVFKKEYMGGYFDIISHFSMAARRAGDYRVQINDEIDGGAPTLSSGEGRWLEVLHGHVTSWGERAKIFDFSSPTTEELSEINRECNLGDYRKYLIPCPHCAAKAPTAISLPGQPTQEYTKERGYQELVDLDDSAAYGIKGIYQAGDLVRAVYVCQYCGGEIQNHQKTDMLSRGHWEATKKSSDPSLCSWQIGALYAPVGMISWTAYFRERQAAMNDSELMRVFQNIRRGLPYAETGARPDIRKVIALRGNYAQREVQPGVLYLTAFLDLQRGKDPPRDGDKDERAPDELPRLEMEVLGHGRGYRTWSIDYRVFHDPDPRGPGVNDPFGGAWEAMDAWARGGGLAYKRADGTTFYPAVILIDSGDRSHIVYAFCGRWKSTYPSKGMPTIVADPERRERGDIAGTAYKRWRIGSTGDVTQPLYEINTQFYKAQLYNKLGTIMRQPTTPQPNGFQDFPRDYPDEYFAQLIAEEQLTDGSFKTVRARNEGLDCRVGNMAAGDIFLMGRIEAMRKAAIANGATQRQAEENVNSNYILDLLERAIPGGCRLPGCRICQSQKPT
jgi:phage terminase large subunit GpA-like protein